MNIDELRQKIKDDSDRHHAFQGKQQMASEGGAVGSEVIDALLGLIQDHETRIKALESR
jgi:hypothetical protein